MSITVNIRYSGEGDSARRFAEEMTESGLVAAVRAEPGNERYEYFLPMDDPHSVLLIDRWADQAAIDAHHRSELMPRIAALRSKYKLRMKAERYADLGRE